MRLSALILFVLPALLPAGAAAQATLNKCIDADGRVTYSNLPCRNAREVQKVEIDPPPPAPRHLSAPAPLPALQAPVPSAPPLPPQQPAAVAPLPTPARGATPAPAFAPAPPPAPRPAPAQAVPTPPAAAAAPRAEIQRSGKTASMVSPRTCDALTDQLGRVLDQMDAGQRAGVTPQQVDAWTKEIQELERKKRDASCF